MKQVVQITKKKARAIAFEAEFFGKEIFNLEHNVRAEPMSYGRAFEKLKAIQGSVFKWDPEEPKTPLAKLLFNFVLMSYLRKHSKLPPDLVLYAAISTTIDWFYGADGIFCCYGATVPIDLTTCRSDLILKIKRARAQVISRKQEHRSATSIIIEESKVKNQDGTFNLKEIASYAKSIGQAILKNQKQQEGQKLRKKTIGRVRHELTEDEEAERKWGDLVAA